MAQDRAQRQDAFAQSGANDAQAGGAMSDAKGAGGTYFLGRYRVVDEIGIGGMASVHLARMDGPGGFQRWAAIKKIHSHLIEDDSFIQMFLDEAQVAARISHPNVAQVFDLGKTEDTYWIAMEYLHGEPLREVMRRTEEVGTAMPPEIACKVIADAAEGLHAAHDLTGKNGEQLNLVHRDVTPHNLFVTYDGITKVLDFGIAKFSSRAAHTKAGTLKGKLAYMSPEQVHGEQLDRRTDVFALGVVLWELTTGRRLFRMESDLDTLAKVQECDVPRPSSLIRGYPIDLEKIVMKALAKNRNDRFKTAKELSRSLQQLLMRRGLFIASDEVSQYVGALFQDRMKKRDEHLKWASEVTQTVNVDGSPPLAAVPKSTSRERESSDVQDRGASAKPLPAAGMPAGPRPVDVGSGRSSHAAPATSPPFQPPRPQAAKPVLAQPAPQQAQIVHDVHPADADGPTIQADVDEPIPESGPGEEPATMMAPAPRPAAEPIATKAPTPPRPSALPPPPPKAKPAPSIPDLGDDPFEDQEDATIVQMGGTGAVPVPSPISPAPAAGGVSKATAMGGFSPMPPAPAPHGPTEGSQTRPPPPLPPQTNNLTLPLDAMSPFDPKAPPLFGGATMALGASANPAFLATGGQPSGPQPPQGPQNPPTSPFDFAPAPNQGMGAPMQPMMSPFGPQGQMQPGQMGMGGPQMGGPMGGPQMGGQMPGLPVPGAGAAPFDYGQHQQQQQQPGFPGPGGPQMGNPGMPPMDFNGSVSMQHHPSRMAPTVPAMRDMSLSMSGVGAQKKRAPMWVVAAISCAVVLVLVAVVLAIVTRTSTPTPPKGVPSATASVDPAMVVPVVPTAPTTVAPEPSTPATVVAVAPEPPPVVEPAVTPPTVASTPTAAPTPVKPPVTPPGPTPAGPTPGPQPGPTPGPTPVPSAKPVASGPGQLTVVCLPKCEEVRLDGAVIGTGNVYGKEVPAGNHSVTRSVGGKKQTISVTIKPGETKEIRGSL